MSPEIKDAVRAAAKAHAIPLPVLLAVTEIESNGRPFEAADGTTPTFLYERHKFYQHVPPEKRVAAIREGLALAKWTPKAQYKDQKTSAGRLALLDKAIQFHDAEAACRSCSWGLYQIMGENFEATGANSAVQMVYNFRTIEGQIEGGIGFMKENKLLPLALAKNWAAFARGYNGKLYKENKYDTKLADAYARYANVT